jgi:MATE family multidrug resistance protein
VALTVFFYFGENLFIHGLTDIAALRPIAHEYYIWIIVLPLISVASFQLDGIFIGATRGREMRNGMMISTACFIFVSFLATEHWQNHGLWFSYCLFLFMRGSILLYHYPKIERSIKR